MNLLTKPNCDFCGNLSDFLYQINRFQKPFSVYRCSQCGLIFQNPIPDVSEIETFYEQGYYEGTSNFSYEDERKTEQFSFYVWNARIKKLNQSILSFSPNQDKNFLDIGCSFGGLLKAAEKKGFCSYGIELSDFSRTVSDGFFPGRVFKNFLEANFTSNFFDAITLIEVVEHLENPSVYLEKIYQLLKPGGLVLIQTANMDGLQAKKAGETYHYFLPGHLFYFSKKNLEMKLKEIGFKKVKFFHPVEFGLIPKLRKSRGNFKSLKDYLKWFSIIFYHLKSLIVFKKFCLTSSMVVYAWK